MQLGEPFSDIAGAILDLDISGLLLADQSSQRHVHGSNFMAGGNHN